MDLIKPYFTFRNIFLLGLLLEVFGLPLFRGVISIGQFVMLGGWILELDFKRKWQVMKTSKLLWVLSSFFILHLIGLLWTSDFEYAANDIKIKLPLLLFPLLFITTKHKLSLKELNTLLWVFTLSVFAASIACTMVWLGYTKHKVIDIRDISIFHSHIRFALMIDLTVCFLLYDFFKTGNLFLYVLKITLITWLIVFLGIMQSFTGIVILSIVLALYSLQFLKKLPKPYLKISAFAIMGIVASFAIYLVIKEIKEQSIPVKPLVRLENTINGNPYFNDSTNLETENGNLIWANVSYYELKKEWAKKSNLNYDEKDLKGNKIYFTIIRYMSSKGLSKDSIGVSKLTKKDVSLIESGTANYLFTNRSGIESRIHEILYEFNAFEKGKNPTGHSLLMRLEFWRIGWEIIKRKPIFGVGTGDVKNAYINQYIQSKTKLSIEWQKRSHNQFMAITIAFGFIGLIVFIVYLFYPVIKIKKKHYLFTAFFIISLLSMINEDTLETQSGVTFFGFFHSLFLFLELDEK